MNTEKKKQFIINTIFYAIIICLALLVLKYLVPILLPFIFAFCFASILQLPVKKLAGHDSKLRRWITIIVGIVFFALIFLGIAYTGIRLFNWFLSFLEFVPRIYQNELLPFFNTALDTMRQQIAFADVEMAVKIENIFANLLKSFGNSISSFSMNAIGRLSSSIAGIPGLIIKLIICIISCFFFMLDYDKILDFCKGLLPTKQREKVRVIKGYVTNTVLVYLKSYFLLFLLTCVELSIGFYIMGIPYSLIIGILIGIFDILPILGTGGILLPWAFILFVMGNVKLGIGIFVLYLIITIIRNTLEPKLVGKQIGLHPLATLISLYVGLNMLGIIGMIAFPVTLVILNTMRKEVEEFG